MNSYIAIPSFEYCEPEITLEDFELIRCIGHGAYGQVWMCIKKDSQILYAMKIISKHHLTKNSTFTRSMRERDLLERIDNPFVVKLRYSFQDDRALYYVMDYYSSGDLYSLIEQLPYNRMKECYSREFLAEILVALEAIHQNNVIYRDLKLENILLTSTGHIIFTDLGMSRFLDHNERSYSFVGTPQYMSPEIVKRQGHDYSTDFWSYGILAYQLLVGVVPYDGNSMDIVFHRICHQQIVIPPFLSNDAKSFLTGLLQKNPSERLGSHGILDIMNHPFFTGIDWNSVRNQTKPLPYLTTFSSECDSEDDNQWKSSKHLCKRLNFFDSFAHFIYGTDRNLHKRMIKDMISAWVHFDLSHSILERVLPSCFGQIPCRGVWSHNIHGYFQFTSKNELIQHWENEQAICFEYLHLLKGMNICIEDSTILFEGERCLCQWRAWRKTESTNNSTYSCIIGSITISITQDNWIRQFDIHTSISPSRLFTLPSLSADLLVSPFHMIGLQQLLQSLIRCFVQPNTKLLNELLRSNRLENITSSSISFIHDNTIVFSSSIEEVMDVFIHSFHHRNVVLPKEFSLPSVNINNSFVPFILTGTIQESFPHLHSIHSVCYLYGYLSWEENQLVGFIYLDAVSDFRDIQSLFDYGENSEPAINNMINTLSSQEDQTIEPVEKALLHSLFQAIIDKEYDVVEKTIRQLGILWYFDETKLSISTIYDNIQNKLAIFPSCSSSDLMRCSLRRLLVAYELQAFLSTFFIQKS